MEAEANYNPKEKRYHVVMQYDFMYKGWYVSRVAVIRSTKKGKNIGSAVFVGKGNKYAKVEVIACSRREAVDEGISKIREYCITNNINTTSTNTQIKRIEENALRKGYY